MNLLHVVFTSIFSILVLFFLAKWMGNRQVSQMSMFDYINGITIGSIAAEFATSPLDDCLKPLIALVLYATAAVTIARVTCQSVPLRKFFNGKPVVLYENGTLFEQNLAASRLDINEFLTQCRVAGYFDLTQLQSAILETNGQISFLPLSTARPLTPEDLQMQPQQEYPVVNLIIDGTLLEENLRHTGNNDVWLKRELDAQHVKQEEIFLATCDADNKLTVYKKTGHIVRREIFE